MATLTLPGTARADRKFVSIHSDPPCTPTDTPVMLCRDFGKGKVIWSALTIECNSMYDYRNIFTNIIKQFSKISKN
jgi:type 1 glutamine amidotransferase